MNGVRPVSAWTRRGPPPYRLMKGRMLHPLSMIGGCRLGPCAPDSNRISRRHPRTTMIDLSRLEVWFITGSQHLYGPETLRAGRSRLRGRSSTGSTPRPGCRSSSCSSRWSRRPTRSPRCCVEADAAPELHRSRRVDAHLQPGQDVDRRSDRGSTKPLCHLHTQFNRDIPWSTIDMDFMNLNQSAHGDREFGFICARLAPEPQGGRRPLAGSGRCRPRLGAWMRAAAAWHDLRRHEDRPLRRQHAPGRRHRRRQGRGRRSASASPSTATASATSSRSRTR